MKTIRLTLMAVLWLISNQAWSESADNRTFIWLTDTEKTALLSEMRQFLSASHQILSAALTEDADAV